MHLSKAKFKKNHLHQKVSSTFMLFHIDLLSTVRVNQKLIFINKALRFGFSLRSKNVSLAQ